MTCSDSELQEYTNKAVIQYQLPAASLAVWRNKISYYQAASGTLNLETGVEATVDSVFQIGSDHQSHDHLLGDAVSG